MVMRGGGGCRGRRTKKKEQEAKGQQIALEMEERKEEKFCFPETSTVQPPPSPIPLQFSSSWFMDSFPVLTPSFEYSSRLGVGMSRREVVPGRVDFLGCVALPWGSSHGCFRVVIGLDPTPVGLMSPWAPPGSMSI